MSGDIQDWTRFGRVDADGTVYVKTSDGERAVGSWQAGTPEEGLTHFARRFADLVTEVDLMAARLNSGSADAQQALATIQKLRDSLDNAHVVGDLESLATRLDELTNRASAKADEDAEAKAAARTEAIAVKEALVAEAEELAEKSNQWKAAGDRLAAIVEEWKSIHGADRKSDQALWRRYAAARDAFARRRGAHFASLDADRKVIAARKEELIATAEALSESTDWGPTADSLKGLMAEWKAAGRLAPDAEQRMWKRFRAAQDAFFTKRSEVFSARDAEQKDNLTAKRDLLERAEKLDVEADPRAAQDALRAIQAQWHDVGRVPREANAGLQRRMRAVEDKLRNAMDVAWRRTPVEENPLLAQMREQVAKAEKRVARAKSEGDAKQVQKAEEELNSKKQFLELAERTK